MLPRCPFKEEPVVPPAESTSLGRPLPSRSASATESRLVQGHTSSLDRTTSNGDGPVQLGTTQKSHSSSIASRRLAVTVVGSASHFNVSLTQSGFLPHSLIGLDPKGTS